MAQQQAGTGKVADQSSNPASGKDTATGRGTASGRGTDKRFVVERVQTGLRIEKRLLKVLKAVAEYYDLTLGDLVEGIVLHAFDGKLPFGEEALKRIADIKRIYDLELDSSASHRLTEQASAAAAKDGEC